MTKSKGTSSEGTPGWQLIQIFYLLLLSVSAVGFLAPSLNTREGRWGMGLALANLGLVILGTAVTWFAFRQRQRWAWWAVLATLVCYGLPMALIDNLIGGWVGPVSVLEIILITLCALGLIMGSKTMFSKNRAPHTP